MSKEAKTNLEMLMLRNIQARRSKSNIPDLNAKPFVSEDEGKGEIVETITNFNSFNAKDVKHCHCKLLFDLEVAIFARVSCFEYWKLNFLNKQFSRLIKSCEIFKVRRERGLVQPYVFMLPNRETCWSMFDKDFKNLRKLPEIPSDDFFFYGDKETISAGTHLIVIGKDMNRIVVWRYELEMHRWINDTTMITPRVMYGSASHGTDAFFAGGIKTSKTRISEVVSVADKYNAETKAWTKIKGMNKRRKFSSGCFLHGKFYVLGGRDENDQHLTCGESYDEKTDSWKLIPNMLKDMTFMSPQSPPLIAVVNDNLYLLKTRSSDIWVYNINTNAWKKLGAAPVNANEFFGWGVAFKSIGDKLLVIGASSAQSRTMSVYTCRPSPNIEELIWEKTINCCGGVEFNHFIRNCCIMSA